MTTKTSAGQRLPLLRLIALTAAALCIHGYHLGVEDSEIYVPAAKKLLDPTLYPYATEFFLSHGHLSLFSNILAWTSELTHLPMDWTVLLWYVALLFGMIASCWMLASACFDSARARWSATAIATAVLSMPAANTSLLLVDPYLTARSFSTPLTLFTLASYLEGKYARATVAMAVMATIHPQMVMYLVFLMGVMRIAELWKKPVPEPVPVMASFALLGVLPTGFHFSAATGPYREALYSRDYFFLSNWEWYHWLGLLAPLAILAVFWKSAAIWKPEPLLMEEGEWQGGLRGTKQGFERLSFAMIPFGLLSIAAALVFSTSHTLDMFARLQPLRSFHLITIVFLLLLGGVVGEYLGRKRAWVPAVLATGLAVGMFAVARQTYPASPQVELPAVTSSNPWVNSLLWVRQNTPKDAVFAVDSRYFKDDGTDVHGFRSIAERSVLADYFKDGGVVSLFPDLAVEWKQMSDATYGLNHFSAADFTRLRKAYPAISWTVIHGNGPAGLTCPYQERGFTVCRLP